MAFTIKDLIEALSVFDAEAIVKFDFGSYPTRVISWRGSYDEPSLDNDIVEKKTVEQLIKNLKEAISGLRFRAYKGGYVDFNSAQKLWADCNGRCSERIISHLSFDAAKDMVIIHTLFE